MHWILIAASLSVCIGKTTNMLNVERNRPNMVPTPDSEQMNLSAEDESIELMREWDDKMQGFVPEDMITFEIAARGEEEFYEMIDIVPSVIRGAWFLASGDSKDIDFTITDPLQTVMFERKAKKEAVFQVDAKRQGIYVFKFKNTKVMTGHSITFTFNSGNSTNEVLKSEHLTPVEENLVSIQKSIKDFQVDNQFAQLRQETHYKTVASANTNVFWFSLLESVGVIGVTAWQIYYIKKLLDNRRVL